MITTLLSIIGIFLGTMGTLLILYELLLRKPLKIEYPLFPSHKIPIRDDEQFRVEEMRLKHLRDYSDNPEELAHVHKELTKLFAAIHRFNKESSHNSQMAIIGTILLIVGFLFTGFALIFELVLL